MGDVEWKVEQVQFLLLKGFFYPHSQEQDIPPVGGLLAGMKSSSNNLLNTNTSRGSTLRN
jgi:hypothetical protein